MEKPGAGVEPAERREGEESVAAELFSNALEILPHRRNPTLADQAVDLRPEGNERDEVNRAKRTDEKVSRAEVGWTPDFIAPEQPGEEGSELAMAGDEAVGLFRHRRETGQMLVTPDRCPSTAACA